MVKMDRKYPRAKWHDYNMGTYFVTVCTHERIHYFGEISNGEITHTPIGAYLCRAIEEIGLHYPEATVDHYVVMPNHFHAIITLVGSRHAAANDAENDAENAAANAAENDADDNENPQNAENAATINTGCLRPARHLDVDDNFSERNHFNAMLSRTLGGLKSAVSKQAHLSDSTFRWQPNFHDHIIRNQREYDLIANYIDNNILNWNKDKFWSTQDKFDSSQ